MTDHHEYTGGDGRTWSDETGSWELKHPSEDVILDATAWDLLNQYAAATASIRMWTDMRRKVKDQLVKILGSASRAHYQGRHVLTVIRTRPVRFNQAAFAEDNPGLWDRYREPADEEIRLSLVKEDTEPAP